MYLHFDNILRKKNLKRKTPSTQIVKDLKIAEISTTEGLRLQHFEEIQGFRRLRPRTLRLLVLPPKLIRAREYYSLSFQRRINNIHITHGSKPVVGQKKCSRFVLPMV